MSGDGPQAPQPLLQREKYRIGIICALQKEAIAVQASFDHTFFDRREQPDVVEGDDNSYSFGVIRDHHVVLAHANDDKGNIKSGKIAANMRRSFNEIKLCLLVGICAIIPDIPSGDEDEDAQEALMGDIVVSSVVKEYDYGKEYPHGFKRIELLPGGSSRERNEYARWKTPTQSEYLHVLMKRFLLEMDQNEHMKSYGYPGCSFDILYSPDNLHVHRSPTCECCNDKKLCEDAIESDCVSLACDAGGALSRDRIQSLEQVEGAPVTPPQGTSRNYRLKRLNAEAIEKVIPKIFFGDMASGEKVLKNAQLRDQNAKLNKVIAYEMEGAGVRENLPTVVVKAGCDYGDSHKNKKFQKYACMTAAACAKALIENLQMGIARNANKTYGENGPQPNINKSVPEPSWQEIFSWLIKHDEHGESLNFMRVREDVLLGTIPETGNYFLQSQQYQAWVGDSTTHENGNQHAPSNTIYCHGPRGCGKTVLLTQVAEDLRQRTHREHPPSIVITLYLSTTKSFKAEDYLAAMLGQLLLQTKSASFDTKLMYMEHSPPVGTRPNEGQLIATLIKDVQSFQNAYVLIDALDQAGPQTQFDLQRCIQTLIEKDDKIRVLWSSHDKNSFHSSPAPSALFKCYSDEDDLHRFVQSRVRGTVVINQYLPPGSEVEKKFISLLLERAAQNFLIADRHIRQILAAKPETIRELFQFADDLSTTIDGIYSDMLKQVFMQDERIRYYAQIVISWITLVGEGLPALLLQQALALTKESLEPLHQDNLLSVNRILSICRGLVQLQPRTKLLFFGHPTAYDFFSRKLDALVDIDNPHALIVRICLRQLRYTSGQIGQAGAPKSEAVQQLFEDYPLLQFCKSALHVHLRDDIVSDLMAFLGELSAKDISDLTELFSSRLEFNRQVPTYRRGACLLHLVVSLNLDTVVEPCVASGADVNATDSEGWTPLRWAVSAGNQKMMQRLYEVGADVSLQDHKGRSTLQWAFGKPIPAYIFPDNNLNVSGDARAMIGDHIVMNPWVVQAIRFGNRKSANLHISQELLKSLTSMTTDDQIQREGPVLLQIACQKHLSIIVESLLQRGVQPLSLMDALIGSTSYFEWKNCHLSGKSESVLGPLITVIANDWLQGRASIVETDFDDRWICDLVGPETYHLRGPRNRTALSFAAEMGYVNVVRALLAAGADVGAVDDDGWTPLMWAVVKPKAVKMVFQDVKVWGNSTALLGIGIQIFGHFHPRMPIFEDATVSAFSDRKVEVVSLLLSAGTSWWEIDKHGVSALQRATWEAIPGVLEALTLRYQQADSDMEYFSEDAAEDATNEGPQSHSAQWTEQRGFPEPWPKSLDNAPTSPMELLRYLFSRPSLPIIYWMDDASWFPPMIQPPLSTVFVPLLPFPYANRWKSPFLKTLPDYSRAREEYDGLQGINSGNSVSVTNVQSWGFSDIYINGNTTNMSMWGNSRAIVHGGEHVRTSAWGDTLILQSAGQYEETEVWGNTTVFQGEFPHEPRPYLPESIARTILSSIQIHIDNVEVWGKSAVYQGVLVTNVKSRMDDSKKIFPYTVDWRLRDKFEAWSLPTLKDMLDMWNSRQTHNSADDLYEAGLSESSGSDAQEDT